MDARFQIVIQAAKHGNPVMLKTLLGVHQCDPNQRTRGDHNSSDPLWKHEFAVEIFFCFSISSRSGSQNDIPVLQVYFNLVICPWSDELTFRRWLHSSYVGGHVEKGSSFQNARWDVRSRRWSKGLQVKTGDLDFKKTPSKFWRTALEKWFLCGL